MNFHPLNSVLTSIRLSCSIIAIFVTLVIQQAAGQGYNRAIVRNTDCPVSSEEADLWYFGKNAGIDFRSGTAVAVTNNFVLNALAGSAIICNSHGELQMFTNGMQVWTRTYEVMPNGGDLHGNPGVKMPAIIIPKPGPDPFLYYIFTIDFPEGFTPDTAWGLQYSEVNMELNGGLGDVTNKKNIPLVPNVVEKISATQHTNGQDTWVLTHRYNSNEFCAFLVTENGVDSNYVSSRVGSIHAAPADSNNTGGLMKFSPDGSKVALAIYGMDRFEIFDFDKSTGILSNPVSSDPVFPSAYGVEFSPDGRYLYATTTSYSGELQFTSFIYQFDVGLGNDIFNNPFLIDSNDNREYFCGLQLATDGRIYIARSPSGFDVLGVIYNPKRPGLECNLNTLDGNPAPFNLGGKRSNYGFPEFNQSYFDLPHFDVENVCFSDTTIFMLNNTANVESVSWEFDDPESGNNTSNDFEPAHTFTNPGDYTVRVTETDRNGNTYDYSEVVNIAQLPYPELGDTVYMYSGSNIVLDAGEGYQSYLWSTGATSQQITITDPGDYWVYVENEKCCFNGDSVKVVLFDILVPNAFRPGGINSQFRAVPTSGQAINNFTIYVYNRWGQLVYESNNINEGWDGTYNGQPAPGDVYVWLIQWDVLKDTGTERITYKGNVILLR